MSAAGGPGAYLRRAGRWLSRELVDPPLPLVAVEVRPRAVAAVRLAREGGRVVLGAAATVELPPGALEPALGRPNVLDPDALRAALQGVLERAGALSGGAVTDGFNLLGRALGSFLPRGRVVVRGTIR